VSSKRLLVERLLPIGILSLAVVAVPVMVLSPTGLGRLRNLEQERTRAEVEVSHLTEQIRQLRAEVTRIKSDPAAVERVARDELGLVRQTEVVFQFKK
jgi:cell division protein FtsB